jgi:transcriptional regulator with XRE-family HTH domain
VSERAHGTRTKYVHDGCRCLPCRAAASRYESDRLRRTHRAGLPYKVRRTGGGWWWVRENLDGTDGETLLRTKDREEAHKRCADLNAEHLAARDRSEDLWADRAAIGIARRHLRFLAERGVGLRQVARESGLSRSAVQNLAKRRPSKDRPHRHIRRATVEAVLGVSAAKAARGARVPAEPTWELVNCLRAAGIPKARIARALGCQTPALQLGKRHVLASSAAAIRELHDAAWTASPKVRAHCSHARGVA